MEAEQIKNWLEEKEYIIENPREEMVIVDILVEFAKNFSLSEVAPKQNAIVEDRECLCTVSDLMTATVREGACYCGNCDGKLWEISTNDRVAPKQEQEEMTLVNEQNPPINEQLLVESPSGEFHLASWRPAYSIFTCQSKGEDSFGWRWKILTPSPLSVETNKQ